MSLRLEFAGSPYIAAPLDTVWRRLIDPHFVATSAPGVESVRVVAPGRFEIASALGIGPVKLHLTIDVEIFDLVELESARLRASASASGSTVKVESAVRLAPVDGSDTLLDWTATTEVDGALAALGTRLMEGVARRLTSDFWVDFARRVEAEP